MEIIDAMTVAGKAEVCHWLEKDGEPVLDGLYWRQTYNFHTQALSVSAPLLQNLPLPKLNYYLRNCANTAHANNHTTPIAP